MIGFGLSRSYWALILSRCAEGALNGNVGVTKSMMAEITDPTNRARGFAFLPMIWSLGSTIGCVFVLPPDNTSLSEFCLDPSLVVCCRLPQIIGHEHFGPSFGPSFLISYHVLLLLPYLSAPL